MLSTHRPVQMEMLPTAPTLLTSKRGPFEQIDTDKPHSEDESDVDSEEKGRFEGTYMFGVDITVFLPAALALSTVVGGVCMLMAQIPMLSHFTGISQTHLILGVSLLYALTLTCMTYCALTDPGQLKKTGNMSDGPQDIEQGMPPRAHQSWMYERPIRRYDHWCKWLQNAIGLLNHREFLLLVAGLLLIAMLGIIVDIWLLVLIAENHRIESEIVAEILVGLHFGYSIALLKFVWPIFNIHLGLVSRNETAKEWRHKEHYVAHNTTMGDNIYVHDLNDDEFNILFDMDAFEYDPSRNPFDRGCPLNWYNFWCQPRWPSDAMGDF